MTPLDQLCCRIRFRQLRDDGRETPPGLDESIILPSIGGGQNWGGVSYDPERKLLVVNSLQYASLIYLVPRAETDRAIAKIKAKAKASGDSHSTANFDIPKSMAGTPCGAMLRRFTTPFVTLCNLPPYGRLTAVDMAAGKVRWQRPVRTMQDSGPFGWHSGLKIPIGMPGFGGTLVTRSGLTFSTESGAELWSALMPASGNANRMTYRAPKSGHHFVIIHTLSSINCRL
jgi:quinoprotein glucose dehydrogenase/quinate dehydrogenase (quinone)